MIKGLYINKAGMLPQQRRLDISANNLANINTVGYKKEVLFFRKLIDAMGDSEDSQVFTTTSIDFSPGELKQTGNPLNIAIAGEGFFVIQTEAGEVFTRNGNFTLDEQGRLVTQDGYPVMTDSGELQLAGQEIHFTEKGEIVVDNQVVGRLRLVRFDQPEKLVRIGSSYFREGDAIENELTPEEVDLRPGYLEGSNVEPIREMIEMIELNRQYELGQKSISTQDKTLDKLINQAGRL